ncbi:NACHT domain-containing NTPase [Trichocoleus sp. FACHB-262]|uniref:NACHT domain-containing protein n=1 Tax=Trichocoleus sp. FACHB-262 TaxID=2692869 RepID=UPI00168370A9|nr:NACHT domain-containing NTPase [Trichocoleus sp. FACHB-262]MBD2121369.1 NACHT domain-containing NTPase [Trichocoleus sp. FACHB-262]
MGTRSLQASQKGIEKANLALANYSLNQNALAEDLGLSRQTVNKFFKGKAIDRENFALICERLGLDLENIVALNNLAPDASELSDRSQLDVLVQEVRQKVSANIQKRCGEMRVLDMTRPIGLDTIYTDVNILQEITGRRRLDLAALLQHCNLEEFDHFGFAHTRTERRSGLLAVEAFDKLMLLGKPGAGKTTFLKRLATLCNAGTFQKHRVPIFITLKDFGDSSEAPRLLTYISQWLEELGVQEPQNAEQILSQGHGFLLLDGLDEVSEATSKQVLQEIQSFSDRFPKNAFVVSCRIAAKEFVFQQFTEVEVADFNDEQIIDFAGRWFEAKQLPEKTKRFLAKLRAHPRIQELATNPLLLTLLCLVFEGRTDFPANRSELYEEGLDVLLKKWDGTRSIEREQIYRELSLKRKEDLLSQLAFTTFEPGNYFFKQKDAERLIEAYIQNLPGAQADPEALQLGSEAVLKSIEAQHGLLVERARGIYSFSHLTFHEYFTARELETQDDLHQILMSYFTKKRWREVFLLTTGMLRNADSLLLLLKSQIDEMLVTDEKLQQFLNWVQQRSCLASLPYKFAALRAFYFALAFDRDLAQYQYLALALDVTLPLGFRFSTDRDLCLDRALDCALNRALKFPDDYNFDYPLSVALDHTFDPALKQSLEELRDQLPDYEEDWKLFEQWWRINGSDWIVRLRAVMINHRNIGHNWQFSDDQTKQLQQYYDANILLVDCLNSDCYVSREVREEIEASLLLPIEEIKHRFPGQLNNFSIS